MKRKPFWIIMVFIVLLIILSIIFRVFHGADRVSSTEISFDNIELTDTNFTASAVFTSSGKSFRKYNYTIEGNTLYITVYGGLVNNKYPNGDFAIDIQDDLKNITTVCLNGDNDTSVLYTR